MIGDQAWPPIMPTLRAALYCSVSKWTLTRAAAAGELKPYGKRGRTLTWRRDELDRWMRGDAATAASVPTPARKPTKRAADTAPASSNALERIRLIARGGGR